MNPARIKGGFIKVVKDNLVGAFVCVGDVALCFVFKGQLVVEAEWDNILVPVLLLIIRNGRRRGESIRELAQRGGLSREAAEHLYFGHRKKIENILLGQ